MRKKNLRAETLSSAVAIVAVASGEAQPLAKRRGPLALILDETAFQWLTADDDGAGRSLFVPISYGGQSANG